MFRLTLGFAAATLFAQSVPVEIEMANRAKQLLESTQFKDKAGGARIAAGLRITSLQEALVTELRTSQKLRDATTDGPEYAYIQSLFDALIELEAKVPEDVLRPYWPRWRAEVIILLARAGKETATLLELQWECTIDTEWLAISNLLLERRSARLFERMLDGLPVKHGFYIPEQSEPDQFAKLGPMHWDPGSGSQRSFPSGFPPVSLYTLTLNADPANVLVARGPRNVYFHRALVPSNGSVHWPIYEEPHPIIRQGECELEYLARLGGRPLDEVRQLFTPFTRIGERNDAGITREMDKKLDEQVNNVREFVRATMLHSHSDPFLVRLELKPTLTDLRRNRNDRFARPKPREIVIDLR